MSISSPFTMVMDLVKSGRNGINSEKSAQILRETLIYNFDKMPILVNSIDEQVFGHTQDKNIEMFLKKTLMDIIKEYGILLEMKSEKELTLWSNSLYDLAMKNYMEGTWKV